MNRRDLIRRFREAPPTHPTERQSTSTHEGRNNRPSTLAWMNDLAESVPPVPSPSSFPSSSSPSAETIDILNRSLNEADAAITAAALVVQQEDKESARTSLLLSPSHPSVSSSSSSSATGQPPGDDIISRAMAVISSSRKMFDEGLLRGLEAKGVPLGAIKEIGQHRTSPTKGGAASFSTKTRPATIHDTSNFSSRRSSSPATNATNALSSTNPYLSGIVSASSLQVVGTAAPVVMANGQRTSGPRFGPNTHFPLNIPLSSSSSAPSSLTPTEKTDADDDIVALLRQGGYEGSHAQPLSTIVPPSSSENLFPSHYALESTPSSETVFPDLLTTHSSNSVSSAFLSSPLKKPLVSPSSSFARTPTDDKHFFTLSPGGESVTNTLSPLKSSPLTALSNTIGFASRIPSLMSPVSSPSSSRTTGTSSTHPTSAPSSSSSAMLPIVTEGYKDPVLLDALSKLSLPTETRTASDIRDLLPSLHHAEPPISTKAANVVHAVNLNETSVSAISVVDSVNTSASTTENMNVSPTRALTVPYVPSRAGNLPTFNVAAEMDEFLQNNHKEEKPKNSTVPQPLSLSLPTEPSSVYVSPERIVLEDPEVTVARLRRRLNAIDDALAPKLAPYLPQYGKGGSELTLNSNGAASIGSTTTNEGTERRNSLVPVADTGSTVTTDQEPMVQSSSAFSASQLQFDQSLPNELSVNLTSNNNKYNASFTSVIPADTIPVPIPAVKNDNLKDNAQFPLVLLYNPELRAYVPAHQVPTITKSIAYPSPSITEPVTIVPNTRNTPTGSGSLDSSIAGLPPIPVASTDRRPSHVTDATITTTASKSKKRSHHKKKRKEHTSSSSSSSTGTKQKQEITSMGFSSTETLLERLRGVRENKL